MSFFVFVYDVSDDEINKLRATSDKIQVINIDKEEIEKYNNDFAIKHLNRSTYMRLAVPRLLKDKVEYFIYLDADTLCFDKLNDINSIDISNVICAVSHDSLDIHDTKMPNAWVSVRVITSMLVFCILISRIGLNSTSKTKQILCYLNKEKLYLTLIKML